MAACPMPWFPMYASELLSDEDFQMWTPSARGCWLTLSARCWQDGTIPEDITMIMRLCGETNRATMQKNWDFIKTKFMKHPDLPGRLVSRRIEGERCLAMERAEKISKRGKAGAMAKWNKRSQDASLGDTPSNASDMLEHPPSNASDMLDDGTSPSPLPKRIRPGRNVQGEPSNRRDGGDAKPAPGAAFGKPAPREVSPIGHPHESGEMDPDLVAFPFGRGDA